MAEIGGYRSPVDIGLARSPSVQDTELYEELTPVYNAIHLLNQYLDRLRLVAEGGGSGQDPAETLPFNRFFVGRAAQAIEIGDLVSPWTDGIVKGALSSNYTSATAESNFSAIALTKASFGQELRVGIGPAAVPVPGISPGAQVWAFASLTASGIYAGHGGLYPYNPGPTTGVSGGTVYPVVVGIGLFPGYALIGKFTKR